MEKEHWFVVITGVLSGLIVFGGQILANFGLSLYQIMLFPSLFSMLLLPFVIFKKECRIKPEMLKLFFIYGLLGAVSVFGEFLPLLLGVPVAIVVLLLYTHPIWTIILSKLILKESITKTKLLAMFLVILGMIILVNPFNVSGIGNPLGILIAIGGSIGMSCWIILGRVSGKKKVHPITTKFFYTFFLVVCLLLIYPIFRHFMSDPIYTNLSFNLSGTIWLYILGFAIFANIIPHLFYYAGTLKVQSSIAGIILLLEPVSATLLAAIFLGQMLTWNIFIGGIFVLTANWIILRKS